MNGHTGKKKLDKAAHVEQITSGESERACDRKESGVMGRPDGEGRQTENIPVSV